MHTDVLGSILRLLTKQSSAKDLHIDRLLFQDLEYPEFKLMLMHPGREITLPPGKRLK